MRDQLSILLIEDNPGDALLIRTGLSGSVNPRFSIEWRDRLGTGLQLLESGTFDLILLDLNLSDSQGLGTFLQASAQAPQIPILVLTGLDDEELALAAVRAGAQDYLVKGEISHSAMVRSLLYALERNNALTERLHQELAIAAEPPFTPEASLNGDLWTNVIDRLVVRLADSDAPILLQGETGVGKEVLARKIHVHSARANKPFLKVNCAALPSELIESELFGYERGAFTGAFQKTVGKFELADGGTILLDEIGDMDFRLQAKLLHVLQDGSFMRLGSKEESKVNVRLMAATHCDLESMIENGKFRRDLYYRLNVVNILIPPLRERSNEILPLVEVFLEKYQPDHQSWPRVTPALQYALLHHDWPGNIRELENVVRKLITFKDPDFIAEDLRTRLRLKNNSPQDGMHQPALPSAPAGASQPKAEPPAPPLPGTAGLEPPPVPSQPAAFERWAADPEAGGESHAATPPVLPPAAPQAPAGAPAGVDPRKPGMEAEAAAIEEALRSTFWNRRKAARLLGLEYKVLLYRMKKLGIATPPAGPATPAVEIGGANSAARQPDSARNPAVPIHPNGNCNAGAILAALNATFWNRRKAAALLNLDYKVLLYRMQKLGIGQKEENSRPTAGSEGSVEHDMAASSK